MNLTTKNSTLNKIAIVALSTILVSGFGFMKEIFVAKNFGLSELLDTFYIAVLAPSLIKSVFLNSFQTVFIPNYIAELKQSTNIGGFQSTSFLITLFISCFFFILTYFFTDLYLETIFKGHTENYYNLVKSQFYYIAPCLIFWGLTSLINALLNIDNEFKYSSLSPVFTPISIIICITFFSKYFGNSVLAIGTLFGSIISFIFITSVAYNRKIIHLNKPDFTSKNITMTFSQLPAKVFSSILNGINPFVDQYFSAQLIIGSIAALNYGIKIPAFTISISSIAIGNVLLPYFSRNALDDPEATFKKLKKMIKYILIGTTITMLIVLLISTPIISFLFERDAFTANDTQTVSRIQQMYLLQLPSYVIGIVMVKFLTSINRNNFMVFSSLISLILNIVLNYLFIKKWGVYGLALSTSLVSIINSLILHIYINRIFNKHV